MKKTTRKKPTIPKYETPFLAELKPVPLTKVDMAFPAHGLRLLPKWEDIPEEFKGAHVWVRLVEEMFYGVKGGVAEQYDMEIVDGIDCEAASLHLQAALGSFEPKHEHKMAGVA